MEEIMSWLPTLFERKSPLMFEDFFDLLTEKNNGGLGNIAVDVKETPSEYIAKFNIPGVQKNEISISLTNQMLTISAERKEDKEEKDDNYIIRQRRYGTMQQSVSLPFAGSPDDVKADLKDGVLTVHVMKSRDRQSKRIPIQ